jgi:cellulose synthase operon protein B
MIKLSSASIHDFVRWLHQSCRQFSLFVIQMLLGCSLTQLSFLPVLAQSAAPVTAPVTVPVTAPVASPSAAVVPLPKTLPNQIAAAAAPGQYVLEFNRSPVVGNRLRLESIYDETRLRFTRPRNWEVGSVKLQLRYRHSPALYASRSNLTVLVNSTSIGSVPLNQPEGKVGTVLFEIPARLIQDYNDVTIAALQNNSPTCTQDPYDPSLWSEILPDSKLLFEVQPQAIPLNFDRYPYPVFDSLSLEANQIAYLRPDTLNETWLTAASRLQASLGETAQYRAMETRVIDSAQQAKPAQRLIVIGTPAQQPILTRLTLPLGLKNQQMLDANQQPLAADVGVLMLAASGKTPVLVATGNSDAAVAKAVQFLVQSDRKLATGNLILVNQLTPPASLEPRDWHGYLPAAEQFQLSDLQGDDQPYQDVSVRGSHAPALEFDFRSLPDERLLSGSSMTLRYSYGPQVNPLTSQVEVQLDGMPLAGARLTEVGGEARQSLRIDLPPDAVKPNSKMQVNFRLDPRERRSCSRVTDQQLWGKIHADTSFDLKREQVARLPDLKLLQAGYPFVAPQDLSSTAIVVPSQPSLTDLHLMLETSERLGRLSRAETVQLTAYRADKLPESQRQSKHLIAIGIQSKFPFPETSLGGNNLVLQAQSARRHQQSQIQTLPDEEGLLKASFSPWNDRLILLALTSQTPAGLDQLSDLISQDALFYQIEGDTVLISANTENPSPYDAQDYQLEILRQSPQREVTTPDAASQATRLLRNHWFVLAPGLIVVALILYGITQFYLKKFTGKTQ